MKHIYILMLSLIIASCVTTKESTSLFENYNTYVSEINKNKSDFFLPMLSKNRVNQINLSNKNEFPVLSEFPRVLSKIESHYQKLETNKGCLTINGYGKNNKPIVLSIKYLYENNKWGVDFVEIYYADSIKEFPIKGICPSEN